MYVQEPYRHYNIYKYTKKKIRYMEGKMWLKNEKM